MGAAVAEGDQSNTGPAGVRGTALGAAHGTVRGAVTDSLPPLGLEDLLLLDSEGSAPVSIHRITFDDDGIGVSRLDGDAPRVLPWESVSSYAVEAWGGGIIPEWWVDPELNQQQGSFRNEEVVTDPSATSRPLPNTEAGALINIQTPYGTFRFLLPGGDANELTSRVGAFAVLHKGGTGASSVTTVAAPGLSRRGARGRRGRQAREGAGEPRSTWARIQPVLVVMLIAFVAVAIALVLLQSAGRIDLRFLGGANSGSIMPREPALWASLR